MSCVYWFCDGRRVTWADDMDAAKRRITEVEGVLRRVQTALSQTSPVLWKSLKAEIDRALGSSAETGAESRPSFRGWIQSACENCGKLAAEHPQPNMWCYETDRAGK